MSTRETYIVQPTCSVPPAYDTHIPSASYDDYGSSVVQGVHVAAVPTTDQFSGAPGPLCSDWFLGSPRD